MDKIIKQYIETTELQLQKQLERFFLSVYPENRLISHGIAHHRRVWKHALELIIMKNDPEYLSPDFLRNLITACFLHDIGMAEDHGFNHGLTGKKKCLEFLSVSSMDPSEFDIALEAIEYHDNKNYNDQHVSNKVLHILSLADDLDAYGFTGIYRYADIYLRRNIDPSVIGPLIRMNAAGRFDNFRREKDLPENYRSSQNERYRILDDFFAEYEKELLTYSFGNEVPSGYCGVVYIILNTIKNENEADFSTILHKYSNNKIINWFLGGYLSEIAV